MPLKQVIWLNKACYGGKGGCIHIWSGKKFYKLFHYVQDVRKASMALKFLQVFEKSSFIIMYLFKAKYENEVSLFYDAASD